MKYSSLALASLSVLGAVVEAKTTFSAHQIQHRLNQVNKQTLLRNARKLEDAAQEEEWEITQDYSIRFNECLTLTVMADQEDGENDDGNAAQSEDIQPTKDYVILDVIYSYDGSIKNYAIDLVTFVNTLANYIPEQQEDYCEACEYDYCYANGDADEEADQDADEDADEDADQDADQDSEEDAEEDADADGDERRLAQNAGKIVYTDCATCEALSCFEDDQEQQGDDVVYTKEDALEWLMNVGECQGIDEENYGWNNQNGVALYAGFTCNAAGTGMEIGVFQDEECSQLTEYSYANILSSGGLASTYHEMTKGLVLRTFKQYFDCADTEYINPGEDQEDADGDQDEDEFGANEYCQELVSENAVAMGDQCDDGDEDEDKYGYDENGNPWGQYTDGDGNTIYYDIQDSEDVEQVCVAIQSKNGSYDTAHVGNSDTYNYKGNLNGQDDWEWDTGKEGQNDSISGGSNGVGEWWANTKNTMGGKINQVKQASGLSDVEFIGAIVGGILALILLCVGITKCSKKEKKGTLDLDEVENSRREPLVSNPEVYIA